MQSLLDDLGDLWQELPATAQDALVLLFVIFVIWFAQRYIVSFIYKRLTRLASCSRWDWDNAILTKTRQPLRIITVALALGLSVVILGLGERAADLVLRISSSMVILAVFMTLSLFITYVTQTPERFQIYTNFLVDEKLIPFVRTGIRVVLIAFGIVIILDQWGYDVNGLIAGLGIGGMAIALAAQDTLANIFGFTTIVGDRPFVQGEYIKTPDVEGLVEKVGIRATTIRQLDQAMVYVPNQKLTNTTILNWSRLQQRRFRLVLGITYDSKPEQIQFLMERLRELLNSHEHVDAETIIVHFVNFGDSALEILIQCYLLLANWGEFTAEQEKIYLEILHLVDELGLSIAFPSQTVYVERSQPAEPNTAIPLEIPDSPVAPDRYGDDPDGNKADESNPADE